MPASIITERSTPPVIESALNHWIENEDTEEYLILHKNNGIIEFGEAEYLARHEDVIIDYTTVNAEEKAITKLVKPDANSLEEAVMNWINSEAADYRADPHDDGTEAIVSVASDLIQGGCASGIVGGLIYYNETNAFFDEHEEQISAVICQIAQIAHESGDNAEFILKHGPGIKYIKNQMAWTAFEETARSLMIEAGFEDRF
ncbi:MAG: hypothetical protein OXG15_12650 [Gammaproteobacteria bacterium]|nr:hypothetical protein [Gammaproteobacteria bacterium]